MDHVRSATRWVSIAVIINMLVVLVGLLTGGSLLVKLVGVEGPAAQVGEALTTVASMLVMALLALLGLGPSLICRTSASRPDHSQASWTAHPVRSQAAG